MNRLYFLMYDAYTAHAWDRANNNLFFKLGTIQLGVIGCLTLYKRRTMPITTQMCSHGQITFSWVRCPTLKHGPHKIQWCCVAMDRLHFIGYDAPHSAGMRPCR
jgi:hypothetical protein